MRISIRTFLALSMLVSLLGPAAAQAQSPPTDVKVIRSAPSQIRRGAQWAIADDGRYVTAENETLKLKFAYNAENYQGWFIGAADGGGGGRDGGIVELYYKPTSPTRNLIFRNGTWGSGYDTLDFWEAENQSTSKEDFDAPDFESGRNAVMNSRSVVESAGRLIATFDFTFMSWRIVRTYTVYPWGDITVRATVTQIAPGAYSFLAHRFSFGVSRGKITNGNTTYDWGGNYRGDGERYHAWTDGALDGNPTENFFHYDRPVATNVNENSFAPNFDRDDQYSGFMLDDSNGNDPDIVVFHGAPNVQASSFKTVAGRMTNGGPYIETAIFNLPWSTPVNAAVGQMTYFYMTTAPGPHYTKSMWPVSLGSWEEIEHVLFRRTVTADDYVPVWKTSVRDLAKQAPTRVTGAAAPLLSRSDNLYHLQATPSATTISFEWTRANAASRAIDYRTAFVVEGFDPTWVRLDQGGAVSIDAYHDQATHTTLLVLTGQHPATPQALTISLGK